MSHWAVTRATSIVQRLLGSRPCPTDTKDILGKMILWTIHRRVMGLRRNKARFHFPLLKAVRLALASGLAFLTCVGLEAHRTCFPMCSMKNPQGPN